MGEDMNSDQKKSMLYRQGEGDTPEESLAWAVSHGRAEGLTVKAIKGVFGVPKKAKKSSKTRAKQ